MLKVQSVMENVRLQQSKRDACYKSYQAAVASYKASKDVGKLNAARKQVDKDHKEATNAIAAIVQELKDKLVQAQNLAEKLIGDKLSRNSYQEQEKKLQIAALVANIENFTDNL